MNTYLDDLFAAKTPELRYAWTFTDISPSSDSPTVHFATGSLHFTERPLSFLYFSGPPRYIDSQLSLWGAEGTDLNPASLKSSTWVDQLVIMAEGAYTVKYGKRTNFGVQYGSFTPEVYTGSNFPGYPEARTAVLIGRIWLGVITIVLADVAAVSRRPLFDDTSKIRTESVGAGVPANLSPDVQREPLDASDVRQNSEPVLR